MRTTSRLPSRTLDTDTVRFGVVVNDKIVIQDLLQIHLGLVCCGGVDPVDSQTVKKQNMKIKHVLSSVLVIGLLAGCESEKGEQSQAQLMSQAKISKADAERTALAKVPGGTVKEGELEKEKGKLIWSFDITTPGTKDITEVAVDAITGDVVAVDKESPSDEAKEKKKEKEEDEKSEK
jgi:uncharacterized membrane protein YkoI